MPKKRELPDYKRPPVTEVAVSIQFARLQGLTAAHIGLYWAKIKHAFPNVMEQPPILHMVENPEAEYKFEPSLSQMPDLPRIWFTDKTGTALVQVQRDRFVYNWRRVKDSDTYIRFPAIKSQFLLRWREFLGFLKQQDALSPQVDQCELTYVNRIDQGQLWKSPAEWGNLFPSLTWKPKSNFLPQPENLRLHMRFSIPDVGGRMHVDILPVLLPGSKTPVIHFSLTVRGLHCHWVC
ncbi:MAG: TIGR04255 family protein [Acidobacteria bacterium]|nr:TIGR04255 family protein [Acidobacteriota bacterium]